jgi:hypothetical protein
LTSSTRAATWKRIAVRALQKMLKPYRIELVEAFSTPGLQDHSALSAEELVRIRDKGSAWPARAAKGTD